MSGAQWHALSAADQQKWDTFSSDAKAIILGTKKPGEASSFTPTRPTPSRKVNLADLDLDKTSAADLDREELNIFSAMDTVRCRVSVIARHNRCVICHSLFVLRQRRSVVDDDHHCPRSTGCVATTK
jgi:hypothetical protein